MSEQSLFPSFGNSGLSIFGGSTGRSSTYVVAASDAPDHVKAQADYVCTGISDEDIINTYLALGDVKLSSGTFVITATHYISIPSNRRLIGSGIDVTIISGAGSADSLTLIRNTTQSGAGNTNIYISDMTIDGNQSAFVVSNSGLLDLQYVTYSTIERVKCVDSIAVSFALEISSYIIYRDCIAKDSAEDGFGLGDAQDTPTSINIYYYNCISDTFGLGSTAGTGFEAQDGVSYVYYSHCEATNGNGNVYGFLTSAHTNEVAPHHIYYNYCYSHDGWRGYVSSTFTNPVHDIYYSHCVSYGNSQYSFDTEGSYKVSMDYCEINDHQVYFAAIGANYPYGISITNCKFYLAGVVDYGLDIRSSLKDITVDNNYFDGSGSVCFLLYSITTDMTHVTITNNIFKNGATYGLKIDAPDGRTISEVIITGNHFFDDQGVATQDNGIYINTNTSGIINNMLISNNEFKNNTTSPVALTGTGTRSNIYWQNNIGYIAPGEIRTYSGTLVPTGTCTATTTTGVFTESPLALKPGANTMHCTTNGTVSIVMPAGSTAVVTSVGGGATVTGSPKTCAAGTTTVVTVTAGGTNDFTITVHCNAIAWHNPEAQDIWIKKIGINRTAAGGTATSEINCGIADNGTVDDPGTEFFENLLANNAAALHDSYVAGGTSYGTQTIWVSCQDSASATGGWVVAKIDTEIANSLAGTYYIEYSGK